MDKYVARKYDGDDLYSWAIFLSAELQDGKSRIIFSGEATPVMTGLGRDEANYYRDAFNKRAVLSSTSKTPKVR